MKQYIFLLALVNVHILPMHIGTKLYRNKQYPMLFIMRIFNKTSYDGLNNEPSVLDTFKIRDLRIAIALSQDQIKKLEKIILSDLNDEKLVDEYEWRNLEIEMHEQSIEHCKYAIHEHFDEFNKPQKKIMLHE